MSINRTAEQATKESKAPKSVALLNHPEPEAPCGASFVLAHVKHQPRAQLGASVSEGASTAEPRGVLRRVSTGPHSPRHGETPHLRRKA